MDKPIVCPSDNVLKQLLQGQVDEPQLSALSQHLQDCGSCQAKAQTLSPHDTFVESLRGDFQAVKAIAEDIPRPLIEKVKKIASAERVAEAATVGLSRDGEPTTASAQNPDLDFLAPPQQPDEIGRLGGYRILKVLGKGGMGLVLLADDPELERQVALKVMLPEIAANPLAKQRFLREARAAAKLKSDHIVTIHRVSEERSIPFLAMELLEGVPLDGLLHSGRQLSLAQILRIGREIAKGLAAAHDRGMIHRDIKPGNIWLDKTHGGRVKILDFGLARSDKDDVHLTQSGAIVGTPAYMAPEQARADKSVDGRADLFSLGCVLYRLTAGDIPFKGDTTMGVLLAIALNNPVAPSQINNAIPQALSELIVQLLDKDPTKRPASAKEVVSRLAAIEKEVTSQKKDATEIGLSSQVQIAARVPEPGLLTAIEAAKAAAQAQPAPSKPSRKRRPLALFVVGLLAAGLLALGGIVFFWETSDGTVRIEINDPKIQVTFDQKVLSFKNVDDRQELRVQPGKHGLHIKREGLEFDTDRPIVIKKGETIALRIEWFKEGKLKVVQGDRVIGEIQSPRVSQHALQFDRDSTVTVKSLLLPRTTSLTLEAFVRLHTEPEGDVCFLGAPLQFALHWRGEVYLKAAQEDKKHANIGITGHLRDRRLARGVLHHVAVVRSPTDHKLFIDGKLSAQNAHSSSPLAVATDEFVIGGGLLADINMVRVSNSARYDADFTPVQRFTSDTHTLALYLCDEGSGDILKDSSGNGHHGKIVGAKWVKAVEPPTTPTPPPTDHALLYDGNAKVEVASLVLPVTGALTLEAYVTQTEAIKTKLALFVGTHFQSSIYASPDSWCMIGHQIPKALVIKTPLKMNRRVHLAGVKSGKTLRLYMDGKKVAEKVLDQDELKPGGLLFIGEKGFVGLLDEVRISRVARYDQDFTPQKRFDPDADTLALYHCDEGGGAVLHDSSGNGHHGQMVGVKWVKVEGAPPNAEQLAAERRAAEKLNVLTVLQLQLSSGKRLSVGIKQPLPAEPFAITEIHFNEQSPRVEINTFLQLAAELRSLEKVVANQGMWDRAWTDAALAQFAELPAGKTLTSWVGPHLTPGMIDSLKRFPRLTHLYVHLGSADDALLVRLKELPALTLLHGSYLGGSGQVTARGLAALAQVRLTNLGIQVERISGQELGLCLGTMTELLDLTLRGPVVDDATLAGIARSKSLTTLYLPQIQVTDAGLLQLAKLSTLRQLTMEKCPNITEAGVKKLAAERPDLTIAWDGGRVEPRVPRPARFTNSLGMEFALVPKGKAWLGGGAGKPGEKAIAPDDFYLGVYEVTQEQWEKVMGKNPSHLKAGHASVAGVPPEELKRFPVESVSWDDCQQFIQRVNELTKETGWVYRLPTSAEWEYACRGGPMQDRSESAFDFYLEKPTNVLLPSQANCNFPDRYLARTCKVGSYPPNRLGLHDMHGNVREWCADEEKTEKGMKRLVRGGCWCDVARTCRAVLNLPPWVRSAVPGLRIDHLGLRLARVPGAPVRATQQ